MTQTCKNCFDYYCEKAGQDLRACEHHVRLSDADPQPVVEASSSITPELRVVSLLSDLAERVDLIAGQMQTMQMQWDDTWAAILKVRAGEGL